MGYEQSSIYIIISNPEYSQKGKAEIMPRVVKQLKINNFSFPLFLQYVKVISNNYNF
jgi:hypothetical protein